MFKNLILSLVLGCLCSHAFCQKGFFIPKSPVIFLPAKPNQMMLGLGVGGGLDASVSYVTKGDFQFYASGLVHKWTSPRVGLFGDRRSLKRNDQVWRMGFGPVFRPGDDKLFSVVETFVGFSYARFDNSHFFGYKKSNTNPGDLTNGSFRNVNFQINFKHEEKKFEFITSVRLGYFKFDTIFFAPASVPESKQYMAGLSTFNLESGFTVGYKISKVVIRGTAGISIPILHENDGLYQMDPTNNDSYDKINSEYLGLKLTTLLARISLQYNPTF